MKSIVSALVLLSVAFTAQAAPTLTELYQKVCAGQSYTDAVTSVTTTYFQPWEGLLGYALGTQVALGDKTSTCYGQVLETYKFIDTAIEGGYSIIYNFDVNTISENMQTMFQNLNNLIIQLSDQQIACQDSVKIKQLSTRTQKVSGFVNLLFTLAYGIGFDYVKPYLEQVNTMTSGLITIPTPLANQNIKTAAFGLYDDISEVF